MKPSEFGEKIKDYYSPNGEQESVEYILNFVTDYFIKIEKSANIKNPNFSVDLRKTNCSLTIDENSLTIFTDDFSRVKVEHKNSKEGSKSLGLIDIYKFENNKFASHNYSKNMPFGIINEYVMGQYLNKCFNI